MYEYEATKTCPECSEEETVNVAAYINEDTGKETVLAKRLNCERHGMPKIKCDLSKPIGPVTEIRMRNTDAYQYMAEKIRDGYRISNLEE
ncbi:MAG TPA: hypothetical protein VK436_10945 [Methanocella sp.]|nr:hypothetical protein [Methanocella sp.]